MGPLVAMRPLRHAAFTLLEALIAIALSTMLCLAASLAVRVAAQTATAALRFAVDNRLLRAGIALALDELDSWDLVDHPDDVTRQPLRLTGRPFAPLDFTTSDMHLRFDPAAPRAWWRGLGCSSTATAYGDYALFARAGWDAPGADAATRGERRWQPALLAGLANGVGYYAMLDYMPANAIYSFHDASGVVPQEFRSRSGLYNDGSSSSDRPVGFDHVVHNAGFAISIAPAWLALDVDHTYFGAWRGAPFNQNDLLGDAPAIDHRPLALAPTMWPALTLRFKRYIFHQPRFLARAEIRIADPLTGAVRSLALMPTATTLRGARRMRGLDLETP